MELKRTTRLYRKSGSYWNKHPVYSVRPPHAHRAVEPPEGPWPRDVGQVYSVYTPRSHLPLCPGYANMIHPACLQYGIPQGPTLFLPVAYQKALFARRRCSRRQRTLRKLGQSPGSAGELLTDARMSRALAAELEEWQALGAESLTTFPYEDVEV